MPQGVKCIFCKREVDSDSICPECMERLHFIGDNVCPQCGGISDRESGGICSECENNKVHYNSCFCVLNYDGDIVGKLAEIKNKNKKHYIPPLARLMLDKFNKTDIPFDMIIPIPITIDRLSERGFNQAEELAQEIKSAYGRVYTDILVKSRITLHQTGLGRKNRKENLKGSFEVTDKTRVKGKIILLIDDVYTTGSTISESAKALRKCGASKVYGLCLCRSPINKNYIQE